MLLGYVKSAEHRAWIRDTGLYNLRADPSRNGSVGLGGRELAADLVVLYGPDRDCGEVWRTGGEPRLVGREELLESGYPEPRGGQYFALSVAPVGDEAWGELLGYELLRELQVRVGEGRAYGAPVVVSWLGLVGGLR